jgi:hypothetical protein
VAVEQFKVMLLTERISFESSGLTTLSREQVLGARHVLLLSTTSS